MSVSEPDPFEALAEVAGLSESLALILVAGPEHRELEGIELLSRRLGAGRTVLEHCLDRDGPDLAATLSRTEAARPVLLVRGLAWMDEDDARAAEVQLNLLRDTLGGRPALIIIWIPQSDLTRFQASCPDLFQWRSLLARLPPSRIPINPAYGSEALRRQLSGLIARTRSYQSPQRDPREAFVRNADGTVGALRHWLERVRLGVLEVRRFDEAARAALARHAQSVAQSHIRDGRGRFPLFHDAWFLYGMPPIHRRAALLHSLLGRAWSTTLARDLKSRPVGIYLHAINTLSSKAGQIEALLGSFDHLAAEDPDAQVIVLDHGGTLPARPGWSRAVLDEGPAE